MRALRMSKAGHPPALAEITLPDPGPDQIRLRVRACGLNFADLLMQKGTYQDTPPLPFTLGMEVSGEIRAVGADVTGFAPGDPVVVFAGRGGLAEEGNFDAARAQHLPEGLSFEAGAACPIAYGTSHIALAHCARLKPGETLLVTGAAGGVGLTAVEIGKLMGARVIAHARGTEKLAVARQAGADHLVEDAEDLRQVVKDLGGADVVYEAVGGAVWTAAFRATNPGGRLLPIGFASGDVPKIPANHLMVKNLTVIGFYLGGYLKVHPTVVQDSLRQVLEWVASGQLAPHISHVLPLDEALYGLELLRSRKSIGKVIITP